MSSGLGSSSCGSFWAARKSRLVGVARAASSARIEDSRPTTKGAIMWGKTTMSRSGTSGSVSTGRLAFSRDFMDSDFLWCSGGVETGRGGPPLSRFAEDRDGVRVMLDHVPRDDALLDVVVGGDLVH